MRAVEAIPGAIRWRCVIGPSESPYLPDPKTPHDPIHPSPDRRGPFDKEKESENEGARFKTPTANPASSKPLRATLTMGFALLWLTCLWPAVAQPIITAPRPASTNQPDPLAAFMVSQPPIDTTSPIQPTAEFEPPVITNGQASVYRVTLNVMEQSVEWPDTLPSLEGCGIRPGASGQFLQSLGSVIIPRTTYLYHVTPQSNGTFTLPAYPVIARGETVEIPAATLTVVPPGSRTVEVAPRIELKADGTEFFVGQNINLQILFSGKPNGTVQTLTQVGVTGDGLIVDRNYRAQRVETRVQEGVPRPVFISSVIATPMRPGRTEATAQGYTFGSRVQGPIVITGQATLRVGQPTYKLVDSEPLALNILPLPRSSELHGFTGAIGSFSVDPPTLSTNRLRAGDLLTLNLTIRGQGNLERVLPPEIDAPPEWQVFQAKKENTLPAIIRQRGFVTFQYQLIPLDAAIKTTPPIPFCSFDPESRTYVDLSVPPMPVTVDPAPMTAQGPGQTSLVEARSFLRHLLQKPDEPTALADGQTSRGRTASTLRPRHQQIGFLSLQLIPAILLGGLWFWDRRRRFFEEHPEVLVHRRARRAIGRHARRARKAARDGDSRNFLHHAIEGFREACAPAAPADPRALICEDVLTALPQALRQESVTRLVRKLFMAANNWRFGDAAPQSGELLQLAGEVDQQLKELRDAL